MCDYPDPDEEYELMYADELELMQEHEEHGEANVIRKPAVAKRSLNFTSPASNKLPKLQTSTNTVQQDPESLSQSSTQDEFPNTLMSLPPSQSTDDLTTNSKRTAEDLFGDVGDIDFDELELPSKKQKTEEENDLDLINKIIEGRKLRQLLAEPNNLLQPKSKLLYDYKENLSINIPKWPFQPITNSEGTRVYVKIESEDSWEKSLDVAADQLSLHANYTSTWEEARKILETKLQKEQEKETALTQTQKKDMQIINTELWVDKYKPESYVDLLSEEPVNRALLHWLHLWDKVVFKKEFKAKDPQQRNSFSKRTGQFQLTNKWKGKKEAEPEMDEDGRPHHKVALLCGPPGVGKTTLAHLLAKLTGYRPVELNASDERSTEAFRTALQNATLMKSVLDADRRPNCLILDEIDGAPLPTVELLVKWCTATIESGKKKGKSQPLRRPVIAICNDLYTPSLRPLRAVALVVRVGGASASRLCARLSRVSLAEALPLAPRVASALAARVQGDVRLAMHVLSFVTARDNTPLTVEDVENLAIGTKDCNKTLMQALQAIFTINDKDPDNVIRTINAAGEYEKTADGIFESYLTARVDARLLLACETLSWLRLHDIIQSWTLRNQNYSLYGMLPLCLARCHRVLASRTPQNIKFPSQSYEMYRKTVELDSIVTSVWRGCVPSVLVSRRVLQRDVLPMLPYLLSPTLRSANVQLCSESEKKSVRSCAGAMCDYGLQYVQQRTPDGLYAFLLEPDVYKIAFFGNEERARPPPPVRQAIAREQQLEVIRRNEEMTTRFTSKPGKDEAKPKNTPGKASASKDAEESRLPNHLQRLKPKEVTKTTPQVHKDFFGRIVPLSQVQRSDAVADLISSSNVFYQYREGFNNAVRRNVRMKDML